MRPGGDSFVEFQKGNVNQAVYIMQMTFGELWALYFERHVKIRNKRQDNAHYFYKCHGSTWATVPIAELTRGRLQDWVDDLAARRGKSGANRAINQMAATINWGIRRGYFTGENPCRYVERFEENARTRFLLPEELRRFREAMDREKPIIRDLFWLCLLTGARRGNVLAMRWAHVDLSLEIWTIPRDIHKNRQEQVNALSKAAMAVLERRRQDARATEWVFPGDGKTGHLVEPKRAWARVLKRARLDDIRIHDLRRTAGSYLAINGESQYIIGRMLGHKDPRSTAIYARLNLDPVRRAIEKSQLSLLG